MRIDNLFNKDKCVFALEVFPPKRQSKVESVYSMLDRLGEMPTDYISVTYSAGGSGAKEYTGEISSYLKNKLGIEPLAHLTCLNSNRSEIGAELESLKKSGVENILALRGDRVPGAEPCRDFAHASDLIHHIKTTGDFYIAAACYPEGHPESKNLNEDVDRLKHKMDSGAGHFVSQLFFDNGKFFRFLNLARKKQVYCPIEAGVMPIVRTEQIERTISLSSASLPSEFTHMVSRWSHEPESFYKAGIDYAIRQCRDLIEGGVDGIHLYAMNNPDVAIAVWNGISDLMD